MSIRVILCFLFVAGLSIYAYRDWFKSLCGALFLMAFLQHPDMPRSIAGIPGLNLWNLLYANILAAWLAARGREGLVWDMPKSIRIAFILYLLVILIAFLRCFWNPTHFYEGTRTSMVFDYLINPMKFLLPCLMLYDGARSHERVCWALGVLALVYFLFAVQVIKGVGLHFNLSSGDELESRAARAVSRAVGYHRVEMSMMLAGASWGLMALSRLAEQRILRWGLWGGAGTIVLAQALTGGRTGYVSWGVAGLALCLIKWRKALPLIPLGILAVVLLMPGVRERMLTGFQNGSGPIQSEADSSAITSGRTVIWPYVIEKIKARPLIGYGRLAMVRTGLYEWLGAELNEVFHHPHNAYLEQLFDAGIAGFLCVFAIYYFALTRSLSLFIDRESRLFEAAGGFALALVLALLAGGMGGQTFYPREGVVGMWAAIGIAFRVWVERERRRAGEASAPDFNFEKATIESGAFHMYDPAGAR